MTEPTWVPEACTLPSPERPLRVAEFDTLFARALRAWDRPAAGLLRLVLETGCETEIRDLTTRETACCSFFAFTLTREDAGRPVLEISVPAAHRPVLDALSARLPCANTEADTQGGSMPALKLSTPGCSDGRSPFASKHDDEPDA
jgi:hypothetical protein